MKTRVSSIVALVLSLILVEGPLLNVAYSLQRPLLSKPSTAAPFDLRANNLASARSSAPFVSKLLSKRPVQDQTTDARIPGQTITTLPDGRLLKTGGLEQEGPVFTITIGDARTATASSEPTRLQRSRAFHTATMLPDGKVLILGGIGGDGRVVDTEEIYDPETRASELLEPARPRSSILDTQSSLSLTPRVYHTATLLTEGIVLIAGGVSNDGEALKAAELWDFRARRVVARVKLHTPRYNHTATLLPDGDVILSPGSDKDNKALAGGELFDHARRGFKKVKKRQVAELLAAAQSEALDPRLAGSIPSDGTTGVAPDALLALRFSKPLRAETINAETATLSNSYGTVEARVTPAESGRLAFVTPNAPLLPATAYTLSLAGSPDSSGRVLPPVALIFTTAAPAPPHVSVEGEQWLPDADYVTSDFRSGQTDSSWQKLASLQAAPGVTALAGQVLKLNGQPLAKVTIQIDGDAVGTDETGRFLLPGVQAGHRVMMIHGHTANKPGKTYGMFEVGVDIKDRQTNSLPYTIWMPVIDNQHATRLSVPTSSKVIARTPLIPDLEVHIPERVKLRNVEGDMTRFSITPIPADRPPFPGPKGAKLFFAFQTHGARVESVSGSAGERVEIIFPNVAGAAPGSTIDLFSYSAVTGWHIYGQGQVTRNGKQIKPPGGVTPYLLGCVWAVGPPTDAPGEGPPPGSCAVDGDPVDLATGLFLEHGTDLALPDVMPIALTRTYRPKDTRSRPFGIGASHPYQMFLVGNTTDYDDTELILADGGRIRYDRISPGTTLGTAVLEHTATPTQFYKSTLRWNPEYGWDLKFKDGSLWKFQAYDGAAPVLLAISDRHGNTVSIIRTIQKQISKVLSPNGRWIEFTYDSSDRVTQVKDNIGRTVGYTYDASGRLWKVSDAAGGLTEYTYDTSHRMLSIKDPRGTVYVTNEYDSNGRVSRQNHADGGVYQFAYTLDGNGKVTQTDVTDPSGTVRRVTFNSNGHTLSDIYALGRPEQQTTTHERQVGTNKTLSKTDSLGRKTGYAYDATGNITSITWLADTPNAVSVTYTYEPTFNQIASVTDQLGHTTSFGYAGGSLISMTDPLNHQTSLSYNAAGQVVSITDPLNHITQLVYDGGDLVAVTDALNRTVTQFVDAAGRILSQTDPVGTTVRYEYDTANRVTTMTDALTGVASFAYDANDNLVSVTDPRGKITTYTYDNRDRLTASSDPLAHTESFEYDLMDNLIRATDRRGKVTTYDYDSLHRLTFVGYGTVTGGGSTTYERTTTNTYDGPGCSCAGAGRLTHAEDSLAGTSSFSYDDFDRVTSETTPQGTVSYAYDAASRQTGTTVSGQSPISYTYDSADRLTLVVQGTSAVSIGYDAVDRTSSLTLPNGVSTEYGYDAASQLVTLTYKKDTTVLGNLSYEYNAAGQTTKMGGSFARTNLPQALAAATYNDANQMTGFGSQILTYDTNGNLTSDGVNTFTWNARNHLVGISRPGLNASFQYDAVGRRISRSINGLTTSFLYAGINLVREQVAGVTSASILTGGVDEFFSRTDSEGTLGPIADALGSTIALTDSAGAVQTSYTYEPFGNTMISGGVNSNSSQYSGRENDGTGLYYYRARYYSPALQRFISEDPIGFDGDVNFYAYVGNAPLDATDPLGLWVRLVFDRRKGSLTATDMQTGKTLSISGVFSGKGDCANNPDCDANKNQGPIPAGEYLLGTKYTPESRRNRSGDYEWYPLYGRNGKGGYSPRGIPVRDPRTGKTVTRGDMFLHTGSNSIGCITVPSDTSSWNPFAKYPQSAAYNKLKDMLTRTSPLVYRGRTFTGRVTVR